MKPAKVFFLCFISYLGLCVTINAVTWFGFTKELMRGTCSGCGDLARLGYITGIVSCPEPTPPLPRRHLEIEEYHGQAVDMVTIGDSFSNGGSAGPNRYYQDYIASNSNLTVLNIEPYADFDFVTQAVLYANNGFLRRIKARYLLLSSSVKYCPERFTGAIDFARTMSMDELAQHKKYGFRQILKQGKPQQQDTQQKPQDIFEFINEANFKLILYPIYYRFSDHAFFSKTYRKTLDRPFFCGNLGTTLLFYQDDIKSIAALNRDAVKRINDNLNMLADRLAATGIQLVFMPIVDKYDLYFDHIVSNKYPPNRFFDELRTLPRRYRLIDTKAIFREQILSGEKDVYLVDDTHWTCKASKRLFEVERFQ